MAEISLEPQVLDELDGQSASQVLTWALLKLHPRVALAWSGAEDVVVLDLMWRVRKDCRVFTLDTGRLNPETYDVMERVRDRYQIQLEVMFPKPELVEPMVRSKGLNLFYDSVENRKQCCGSRKVEPLGRALANLDGWVTGLRRDQAVTRTALRKVDVDADHGGMLKINPIADWDHQQVWDYIRKNDVPYNKLHDIGYPSIGCAPCTRVVKPGEDIRAGRWWWENPETKECGLHVKSR